MAIRDCSNLPDEFCPEWVVRSRQRARDTDANYKEQQDYFKKHLKLKPEPEEG